ncbi:hypothetical protein [Brachybacterium saurashtrense]|uniref:Uncharacterized protein n=1 Tax=Brachybacterium saurashtrense TaxID=556288 RepID=A0A345YPT2_9MICO|nr:hypothetical protein [Brachybacterium saurashtrense]AXK45934.1 hypothetical protein DWV08_10175 [Brachybacterium saurashtrense]RRR23672.1 hypothetical protein DXU92_01925 [Brachybacterium saurashtrense]
MSKKRKRNQKFQRTVPTTKRNSLSRAEFERELTKVVEGDPTADPDVRAFFGDLSTAFGIRAAVVHPHGIEMIRDPGSSETP